MYNNKSIIYILISLLVILTPFAKGHFYSRSLLFVDLESNCLCDCGSIDKPFPNIQDAISSLEDHRSFSLQEFYESWLSIFGDQFESSSKFKNPTIVLKSGVYKGLKNTNLIISSSVNIKSISGSIKTSIDCEGIGSGIIANTDYFSLSGVSVSNCRGNVGGALRVTSEMTMITDVQVYNNLASFGSGLYVTSKSVSIKDSSFVNNTALEGGGAIYSNSSTISFENTLISCNSNTSKYDIVAKKSYVEFDSTIDNIGTSCDDESTMVNANGDNLCAKTGSCKSTTLPQIDESYGKFTCNNDGGCDFFTENCLSCPNDCKKCRLKAWKLEYFSNYIPGISALQNGSTTSVPTANLTNFMKGTPAPVSGILSSYFDVKENDELSFRVTANNMGFQLIIDTSMVINSYFQQVEFSTIRAIKIPKGMHFAQLIFFSTSSDSRNISLEWRPSYQENFQLVDGIYSLNNCNDGILDKEESNPLSPFYCKSDLTAIDPTAEPVCGDGICNEPPENCVADCFNLISPLCPGQAPPSPIFFDKKDTVGELLDNQFLYTLPGVHHMRHGVDSITGIQKESPVFVFDYCDNTSFSIIHDFNRGFVYTLPKGVYGSISPTCKFDTETKFYESSSKMSSEMAETSGLSTSATATGGSLFIKVSLSVAYSEEESVKRAKELETKNSGTFAQTIVNCEISKIHVTEYSFSQEFLKEVSYPTTVDQMVKVIGRFGNTYYKSATMGGSLTQVTMIKDSYTKGRDQLETKKHIDYTMAASVSSPVFSVSAEYSKSDDVDFSSDSLTEFSSGTESTKVITKGGPPGAFSPSGGSYQSWASAVDLLPVPISYKLGYISDIIPSNWLVKDSKTGLTIQKLWIAAEDKIFNRYTGLSGIEISRDKSLFVLSNINFIADPLVTYKIFCSNIKDPVDVVFNSTMTYVQVPSCDQMTSFYATKNDSQISTLENPLEVYDYSYSRFYQLKKNINDIGKINEYLKPNSIYLRFKLLDVIENQSNIGQVLHITITSMTTSKTLYYNLGEGTEFKSANQNIEISLDSYIGTLLSVEMKLWSSTKNVISKLGFKDLEIVQQCPLPVNQFDTSGCTPRTIKSILSPYAHYYKAVVPSTTLSPGYAFSTLVRKQ